MHGREGHNTDARNGAHLVAAWEFHDQMDNLKKERKMAAALQDVAPQETGIEKG